VLRNDTSRKFVGIRRVQRRFQKDQVLKDVLQIPLMMEKSCMAKQQLVLKTVNNSLMFGLWIQEPVLEGFVFMGNDHALKIVGVGAVKIKMLDGSICKLQGVRHVKGLRKNLLSIGQLNELGFKTHIEGGILKVIKGALVVMRAEKIVANLYMLVEDTLQEAEAEASVASASQEEMTMTWHCKLGHMSERGLMILMEHNLIPSLKSVNLSFCEHYVTSKQYRLMFDISIARSKHMLELIHSNLWDSLEMSLGGAKYLVSFIDDYSRRLSVYPIKKKSDVFAIFKEFKAKLELE